MLPSRTLLIVNPIRSRQATTSLKMIVDTLRHCGIHCDVQFTERKGHATELAAGGVEEGYQRIVAVGGDGTLNEIVNGVVGSHAAVFSIPLGAGNDFLRSLGIRTWLQACRMLAEEESTYIDLGLAEWQDEAGCLRKRYYAVLADAGFGSEVVHNTPRRLRHALGGNLGYLVSIYRTAVQGRARAQPMRVTVDGELLYDEPLLLVEAFNGLYGGGGLKVAPTAKLDDGLLDVFLVRDMHWLEIWTLFPRIYLGTHIEHEKAEYFSASEVSVDADKGIRTSVDGELIGYAPVKFSVVPRALKLACPPRDRIAHSIRGASRHRHAPPACRSDTLRRH